MYIIVKSIIWLNKIACHYTKQNKFLKWQLAAQMLMAFKGKKLNSNIDSWCTFLALKINCLPGILERWNKMFNLITLSVVFV